MSNETSQENTQTEPFMDAVERAERADAAPAPDSPEAQLAQARAEADRYRDLALRNQADHENYRKRVLREKEEAIRYANMDLLERLIQILDNFEYGLAAARQSPEGAAILSGMEMVGKQLQDFLKQNGVEPIAAEGQKFDPHVHEAVAQEASRQIKEGYVISQTRRGFKMKDRLIRPASVVVSKGAE
ncbi:MAG TPA: nucleotide exchange factor GrpE [Chthoniobacteraceae bacterium]|jgi:molecular chaperone GrpE|nr:nucleotide exchange factor GrpE [Chthoniobacteraceae bacterium]